MKLKKTLTVGFASWIAIAVAPLASAVPSEVTELRDMIAQFRESQQELVQERRELAESLRDLTPEEKRQAIEDYKAENADRIALHRAQSEQIRELMKAARPDESIAVMSTEEPTEPTEPTEPPEEPDQPPEEPARPQIPDTVQSLIAEFQTARDALIQERLDLLAEMENATDEEKAAALAALREKNAELVESQKEMARQIREAVQDIREERRNNG